MKCPIELAFVQITFGDFAYNRYGENPTKRRRMSLANTEKAMAYAINGKN